MKTLNSHSYLIKVDPTLVRSCLYLIPFGDLVECARQVNVELLDMLVVVLNNTPAEISQGSVTVSGGQQDVFQITKWRLKPVVSVSQTVSDILQHIHACLVEEKYR